MSDCPRILSVIEGYIGHRTYGQLMRDYFGQVKSCQINFNWYNEDKELHARLLNRLLSYHTPNRWIQKQNIDLYLFRVQIGFAYLTRRLVLRKLAQSNYSALHFHTQPLAFLCLDLIKKYPTMISIDRTTIQAARESSDSKFYWTYAPNVNLEKKVFQSAKSILSFSEIARRSVIEEYGISPEKVTTVYPGVNVSSITPALSKPAQICNILFIGGDFKRKGGYDVLEVFLERFSEHAKLHLVTLKKIHCNHPSVHIYHDIKPYTPEWLKLYHDADLFVMPTYLDCTPWVFMEAMAAGLPIVATHINAIPEMVIPGETGFLIEPGDRVALAEKIDALVNNPRLAEQMGRKGRELVEQKFNAQVHFAKFERLLQKVATS